jgi:hypothetical protein
VFQFTTLSLSARQRIVQVPPSAHRVPLKPPEPPPAPDRRACPPVIPPELRVHPSSAAIVSLATLRKCGKCASPSATLSFPAAARTAVPAPNLLLATHPVRPDGDTVSKCADVISTGTQSRTAAAPAETGLPPARPVQNRSRRSSRLLSSTSTARPQKTASGVCLKRGTVRGGRADRATGVCCPNDFSVRRQWYYSLEGS